MIKKFFLILSITMFCVLPAFASHLGPIVFGMERTEEVFHCWFLKDALFEAQANEMRAEGKLSHDAYWVKINPLIRKGRCINKEITYTPLSTIFQWNGVGKITGSAELHPVRFSLLKVENDGNIIYVTSSDEAPPPVSNLKKSS